MMSYLHTKFHDNWICSFRGVAMTRFWDGRTDRQTDTRTDGRSDCTPRPAFAFGDAGKNKSVYTCYKEKKTPLQMIPLLLNILIKANGGVHLIMCWYYIQVINM